MAKLIISLGLGKGTWQEAINVMKGTEWEQIIVVCDQRTSEHFNVDAQYETILIESTKPLVDLELDIRNKLAKYIGFGDVGLNLSSGIGKEHMALLSSLLKLGAGIRLVAWDGERVVNL